LKEVPDDKMVVLGLVTSKRSHQVTKEELITRIKEASRYIPQERLALSPQCGFSTSIVGNRITAEDEEYKLGILVETAQEVWG